MSVSCAVGATLPMALLILFEIFRVVLRALVLLMGAHFALGTIEFLRQRGRRSVPPSAPEEWPHVTIQLPIRNEYYTACRVLEAAGALDYPLDRLQIQVLDDSDDDTSAALVDCVLRLRRRGVSVVHIKRFVPIAFKAGALGNGFASAEGEFVAVFDADFVPPRDFLKRTIPYFADPSVGMVQGRWAHQNRTESWFTKLQANILDGLMIVEQTAKSRAGLPLQFNGTAGVWRSQAIRAAGGWTFDSLTEDLDLSMRAQFAGYRLVHLPDVVVPSELPTTLGLFRVQQRRWALGTAQLLRKRLWEVLKAPLSPGARLALVFQLGRHLAHPLLLLMIATVPLTTFGIVEPSIDYGPINAAVLGAAVLGVMFQHGVAAHYAGRSAVDAMLLAPFMLPLAIGLAPTYTVALWYGLRDRAGAFHRTPKITREPRDGEPTYRAKRSVLILVETLVGLGYAVMTILACTRGQYVDSAFMALVSYAFLWVGLGSMRVDAASHPTQVEPRLAHRAALVSTSHLDPSKPRRGSGS